MQAMQKLKAGDAIIVMDPRLRRSPASTMAVEKVLKLAHRCLAPSRQSRPAMKNCAEVLWGIRKNVRERALSLPLLLLPPPTILRIIPLEMQRRRDIHRLRSMMVRTINLFLHDMNFLCLLFLNSFHTLYTRSSIFAEQNLESEWFL